jgi:hypothetical protein
VLYSNRRPIFTNNTNRNLEIKKNPIGNYSFFSPSLSPTHSYVISISKAMTSGDLALFKLEAIL